MLEPDGDDGDKLINKGWQFTSAENAQTKRLQGQLGMTVQVKLQL